MANAIAHARQRFFDAQGVPLAFGKVWTYNAGTSVPRPTFADAGEVTMNTNPVILDANGEATIYWNGSYKVNLTTAADVQVPGWPEDNITTLATNANAGSSSYLTEFFTTISGQTVINLTQFTYTTGTDSIDVYMNGLKLRTGLDYVETGPSIITLTSGAALGDEIEVKAIQTVLITDAAALATMLLSTSTGKGASQIGVEDAADNFQNSNVEAVLAETMLRAYSVELERYSHLTTLVGAEVRWDAAFSAAVTKALATNKPIYLGCNPVVKYFTTTWDLTANDTTKDGLQIFGAGIRKSKPYFRNTTGACIEVQGTDRLHLRDFQVAGDCPVGIAGGRATIRQWNGRHYYENLAIIMPDNMAANGGIGTIGLLGLEPEESTYHCCEFWANLPVFIGPPNQINVKTFTTAGVLTTARSITWTPAYTPILGTLLSNTIFHFTGGCRMVAYQPDTPPVVLRSASGVDLGASFLQTRGGGLNPAKDVKKCPYAIDASNVWNLQWFGTGERGTDDSLTDVGAVLIDGSAENWTISANAGTANSATLNLVPVIYIVDATGALHRNCDLKFRLNSHQGQYPFGFSNSAGSSIKLENCNYRVNTTASLSTIPQSLLYNMSGSKISLSPLNATVPVVLEKPLRYKSILQAAKDLPHTVATTVATCVLPPTGMSAGTLQFRNVVLTAGYLNSGPQIALITGEFDVSWTRTAATTGLTVTVTRSSFSASVKTAASSLDIAAPTVSALLSGQASFQVQVLSNISGTSSAGTATWFSADVISSASLGTSSSIATVTTQ